MSPETQLIKQYAHDHSPQAFAALVDRYIGVVYAAARRQVRDADLAHDVTQAVFLVLAEKAATLDADQPLSGWLLKVTRYASANAVRSRARRARHEQEAAQMNKTIADVAETADQWQEFAPLLDEGMSRLRAGDRDVLLLRYFEQKNAREMGVSLGISEDAAEKRLARAVEKLRDFFRRRGVAMSAPGISAGLLVHASEATPKALRACIPATASSSATSIAKGVAVAMATAKAKTAAIAAVLALLLIGGGAVAWKAIKPASVRHIDVSAQLAAVTVAQNKPSPWAVTFSDGTKAELLALTDKPGTAMQWWAPDGSPVAAPSPLPRNILRIIGQPNVRPYQLSVRESGANLDGKQLWIEPKQNTTASAGGGNSGTGDVCMMNLVFAIADDPGSTDMILHLASGPWGFTERYNLKSPAPQSAATTAPVVTTPAATSSTGRSLEIGAMTEKIVRKQKTTTIVLRRLTPLAWSTRQEEIKVVTVDGREIGAVSSTGSMFGINEDDFPVARDQIVGLVFRARPYETLEIRNVSLRPGVKTVPVIVAVPPPVLPASHPSN